ncbi:hypothetical protein [Actinomadura sp. 9N407]|uniref:hypothetical protein n=1 Tax=Actinomadura sp. 9N407 TaxID=3375154 RepID=UPI00378AAED6
MRQTLLKGLWISGALLFFASGCGVLPARLVLGFTAGDPATAQVTSCMRDSNSKVTSKACSGTWRTDDGEQGSGHISGATPDDNGREVEIRTGPFGTYIEPITANWQLYPAIPALIWIPYALWRHRRSKRLRRSARSTDSGPQAQTPSTSA